MKVSKIKLLSLENKNLGNLLLSRSNDCVSTVLDGETVILDIASGIYSGVDAVGTFIWSELEKPTTVFQLRDALLLQYDVKEDQCLIELLDFLKDLVRNSLLIIHNE